MKTDLDRLIDSGQVSVGDELFHRLRRHARGEFTARVVDGGVVVDGKRYSSLSTAARALAGYPTNGWIFWHHRPSGRTLAELRKASGG